jgi:poly(3-hydroxybutyrate) depolymerase
MVIDFHGYYDTGPIQEEQSGIKAIADEYNFIAVWPNGLDDTVVAGFDAFSWNAVGTVNSPGPLGDTCKWEQQGTNNGYPCHTSCQSTRGCRTDRRSSTCDCSTCADDVLFTTSMLDKLETELCIDTAKVFLTGMSNGAMMVYELATHSAAVANRFAAIAPVAGSPLLGYGKVPPSWMPIMEIHGSTDNIIPANVSGSYRGERCPRNPTACSVSSDGFYYEVVDSTMERFATANRCDNRNTDHYPTEFDGRTDLYCVTPHGRCEDAPVVRCTFTGGHTWPFGNGDANRRRYALLIWEFFSVASKSTTGRPALPSANATKAAEL